MVETVTVSVWRENGVWYRLRKAAPSCVYEEKLNEDGITWEWVSATPPDGVQTAFDHDSEG